MSIKCWPPKPHFYVVNLGFTGVYIIFPISAQKHYSYSLEPPRRGGSYKYRIGEAVLTSTQIFVLSKNMKISEFVSENVRFAGKIFSIFE